MSRGIATIICTVVFVFAAGLGIIPGATAFATLSAQKADVDRQLVSIETHNRELASVEKHLEEYRQMFAARLGNVSAREAPNAFAQSTLAIAAHDRVDFGQQSLQGPLTPPTPIPVDSSLTGGPTPPPTPPPALGAASNSQPTPGPVGTTAPIGFAQAANLSNDPWGLPLTAYAGSIDIVGSYADVVSALQDLSRQHAFVRVMRATLCRADNDVSDRRTLSVIFRLYGLQSPPAVGS